jgi:saccharopine dehydrogenase (NAD+, L-lysine-forming)
MSYKVLIVGCGAQGKVISTYLNQLSAVDEILLGDLDLEACKLHAQRVKSSKLSPYRLNAAEVDGVASLAKRVDIIVNAVPPRFNLSIMDAAIKSGAHYVDLAFGPPYDIFDQQMKKNDAFRAIKRTALLCTGSSPGITNVLVAHAAEELEVVKSIRIRLGDRLESKEPIMTWSPETMLGDMAEEPIVFENGEYKRVPPFNGEESFDFPSPVGPQPTFMHVHEEAVTLPRFVGKGISYLDIKMGSPDMPFIKFLVEMGLCSGDPIEVAGVKVAPRDLLLRILPSTPTSEEIEKKVKTGVIKDANQSYVVEVTGKKSERGVTYKYTVTPPSLRRVQEIMPGATHESFLTGSSAAIFTEVLGEGRIEPKGVILPECLDRDARQAFLAKLAQQDVKVSLTTETALN